MAAQNNNTIVVTNSVGPLILEPWVEHPNVTAVGVFGLVVVYTVADVLIQIVWASLGGNEAGDAIAAVLYGDYNPSGRLPYTIAKNASDYSAQLTLGGGGTEILPINYSEGCVVQTYRLSHIVLTMLCRLFIDYRWFDAVSQGGSLLDVSHMVVSKISPPVMSLASV